MIRDAEHSTGRTAELDLAAGRITFEEYLSLPVERAEWVDGEVIEMSPVSMDHQDLLGFLAAILRLYSRRRGCGSIYTGPATMHLSSRPSGREPDLFFVRADRAHLVRRQFLDGPADMALEIVSPESSRRDRRVKFEEYAQGGVREYWLLDPENDSYEFYTLGSGGQYSPMTPDEGGVVRSDVIEGFYLRIDWLRARPLPDELEIAREWNL